MTVKIHNDFSELLTDLGTLKKKEKNQEYKNFLDVVMANISLWQLKTESFFAAADGYKDEEKATKSDKRSR